MSKFKFRLQRVLEYRESQEEEAKLELLARRAATHRAEAELEAIHERRNNLSSGPEKLIASYLETEDRLAKLEFDRRVATSALSVLRNEEEAAETKWRERRKDLKTMTKLHENEFLAWTLAETRREQAALDEWAVLRRQTA